jgi:hypothetical protein
MMGGRASSACLYRKNVSRDLGMKNQPSRIFMIKTGLRLRERYSACSSFPRPHTREDQF